YFFDPVGRNDAGSVHRAAERANQRADRVSVAPEVTGPEHALAEVAAGQQIDGISLWHGLGSHRMDRRPQIGMQVMPGVFNRAVLATDVERALHRPAQPAILWNVVEAGCDNVIDRSAI